MSESATPEPDTSPPEEEGEKYDGGEIPGTPMPDTSPPEEDGEN